MEKLPRRIRPAGAALLLIDFQERLLPAICGSEAVLKNVVRLAKGAALLRLPVLLTEQYRKGLGPTVSALAEVLPGVHPREKLAFSACAASGVVHELREKGITDVVLCGIEAHVCVAQTALDLLDSDFRVFVAADAVGSRTLENRQAGLERMRDAGAVLVSAEMILFELLGEAGTDRFRQILALIK